MIGVLGVTGVLDASAAAASPAITASRSLVSSSLPGTGVMITILSSESPSVSTSQSTVTGPTEGCSIVLQTSRLAATAPVAHSSANRWLPALNTRISSARRASLAEKCHEGAAGADEHKQLAFDVIERNAQQMTDISDALFYFGELGMQEFESTKLLKDTLTAAGFKVELGGADMPTNFWAEYGSGRPKIAIVTEVDALPGGSQTPGTYERKPLVKDGPGHMEGHNTHGGVASLAAFAVKEVMRRHNIPGTVTVSFGPAEEQIASRPYLVRAGYFKDVDAIIRKKSCDAFLDTDLEEFLRARSIDRLIVTGCATDYCVDTTVRSALARGYPTTVPSDGHTTSDRPHLAAAKIIEHHNAIWSDFLAPRGPALVCPCSDVRLV